MNFSLASFILALACSIQASENRYLTSLISGTKTPASCLKEASSLGQTSVIHGFLSNGFNFTVEHISDAIIAAVRSGHSEAVKLLMSEYYGNRVIFRWEVLYEALMNGWPEVLEVLLATPGISPDCINVNVLLEALENGVGHPEKWDRYIRTIRVLLSDSRYKGSVYPLVLVQRSPEGHESFLLSQEPPVLLYHSPTVLPYKCYAGIFKLAEMIQAIERGLPWTEKPCAEDMAVLKARFKDRPELLINFLEQLVFGQF